MEETIDYEALCGRLVVENEKLRQVLSSKAAIAGWSVGERLAGLRDFIEENYLVLMFAFFVGSAIIGGIYTVIQNRTSKHE